MEPKTLPEAGASPRRRLMMGNEAIAQGLVEAGCTLAASYPGTPASEILPAVVASARAAGVQLHAEWSVNEKVALEVALGHSYTGQRAAVAMKQVGLNVASDPLLRSAYLGIKGGLLVVVADDPGPHSSQTEQDSRFLAMFAKLPVLDPATPRQAKEMVAPAYELAEKYELPVLLRPTTRICHARQVIAWEPPRRLDRPAVFTKDPSRWCATPQFLRGLHRELNRKIRELAQEPSWQPRLRAGDGSWPRTAVVAAGVAWAHAYDWLLAQGLLDRVDFYQVVLPYPLNPAFAAHMKTAYDRLLVLEETYPVIELQLAHQRVQGRQHGPVPGEGELTPEVLDRILRAFFDLPPQQPAAAPAAGGSRPTLCPGCGHRAAFYAIRTAFPDGIFPGDIGCYTLGMNLGAVDTVHCMGAGISQAAGLYQAFRQHGAAIPPIVATIGDSTFFHAGLPALLNAVIQDARILLVILDNGTTAMTGHQPTPAAGLSAGGGSAPTVPLEGLVHACGVKFLAVCDPYDLAALVDRLRQAQAHTQAAAGGPAVVIARRPCRLVAPGPPVRRQVVVTADCIACHHCLDDFECPALAAAPETGQVQIDPVLCVGCGVCLQVCPAGAITLAEDGP
jgi:indolepyruvate ferredoxin oxidoreductase alpha subunit